MKFFKSKQEKEVDRRIQLRQGRRKAERYVDSQSKKVQEYIKLAKKAYQLGDADILHHLVALIQASRTEIQSWEKRLLYFDMIEAQRDQALASAEFAKAFDAMAATIFASANSADLTRMQANLERSLSVAEELEDRLQDFQNALDDRLKDTRLENPAEIGDILELIKREAKQEPESALNLEIDATLKQIRELSGRAD